MLLVISLIIFIMNVPFGYWRANVPKMGLQWFLAIHIPIPFIILMRIVFNIGFAFYTYPLFIIAFFLGQYSGKLLLKSLKEKNVKVSSCLIMDYYRKSVKK